MTRSLYCNPCKVELETRPELSLNEAVEMICELLHTTPSNLTKQDRTTKNVFNRAIVVKLMRERGMMDKVIAEAINRHRTTIIWAYQMANAMYDTNETFRDMYNKVYSNLKSYSICPVTRPWQIRSGNTLQPVTVG